MTDTTTAAAPEADAPDFATASRVLKQPGRSPAEIQATILTLIATFGKSHRRELTDAFLAMPLENFATLKTIRAVLSFAGRGKRLAQLTGKIKELLAPDAPIPHWNYEDRLKAFKSSYDFEVVDLLSAIKYSQSPARFDSLASAAEFYAPRFDLPEGVADVLYDHTTVNDDRDAYLAKLKQGFVVEHILNDLSRRRRDDDVGLPTLATDYNGVWTEDLTLNPTRQENGRRKTAVFLTCHSGMMDHVKIWYKTVFEDGVRMGNGVSDKIVSSRDNPNAALLEAYRAAMEGKPLLIAADSPLGAAKNRLSVFGREVPVADGFVFLSYESRADVFWTMVVPEDGKLALRLVKGPSREEGEKIAAYRPRLLRFVGEQLEAYLAGPPNQIGLRKKWVDALTGPTTAEAADQAAPIAA